MRSINILMLIGLTVISQGILRSQGDTTVKMVTTLNDATSADVIVLTSVPYSQEEWLTIKTIVHEGSVTTLDIQQLQENILLKLEDADFSIIGFTITRQLNYVN